MTYRSLLKGSSSGAYIQAYFQGSYGDEIGLYPGVVMFFFDHFLWLPNRQRKLHRFAFCKWFCGANGKPAIERHTHQTVEAWQHKFWKVDKHCILPIQRIHSQVAVDIKKNSVFVIPVDKKMYL
ncbi:hypothetical protein BD408DRAFT_125627 [Parasitella parasitica]|nr:hypothetical protein BD408DRAFT_125627 [Parasitella parasitica]